MKRILTFILMALLPGIIVGDNTSLVFENPELKAGIGSGKHIVFLAGDHEYRSEEAMPAMARLLAKHHGFKCTVLFNVNKETGYIEPGNNNMPGTEALKDADLMVIFLRFQDFSKEQMQPIVDYLERGGPVVGLRTATHAFKIPKGKEFERFDFKYPGDDFKLGFGRQVLGETWAGHYGKNHVMATRLDLVEAQKDNPILKGVKDVCAQSGGYWADPMPNCEVLALSQPLQGMSLDSPEAKGKKPCPGVWTRTYQSKSGNEGRVFTMTNCSSEDILNHGYRRFLMNGCLWAVGLESKITADLNTALVGPYHPLTFQHLAFRLNVKPSDMAGWDTAIMPKDNPIGKRPARNKKKPANKKKATAALNLKKGDRICLVGNALGERLQHQNTWELMLHQQFPNHNLVVRNLCFPGDEAFTRIRSANFGTPDSHLTHSKASVVLYFFGYNESFAGKKGLKKFKADLTKLVSETQKKKYDGESTPRVVLVSPIAFENTGDKNLPDGSEHNPRLKMYTAAMKEVADKTGAGFADVFNPTLQLFEKSSERLTLNGFHLNGAGYREFGPIFNKSLFGESKNNGSGDAAIMLAEIDDKNFHWWHRYRAVNGFSIYGGRGGAGRDGSGTYNNRDVMERERAILDQMAANRDARIWKLVNGETVADQVDDSNTLPFFEPTTNVGLPDDPNLKRGKLGTLEYLSAEEQKKLFKLAPGYEINLVASEEEFPELANPVEINFDNKGRLWVATMPSYPHWKPKTKLDDKLLIFEDHDKDGKADECKVFAGGLHQPTGFELGYGGAFVAQQPDVLFIKDTDGDDKEDLRIRKLVGFDSADSHHGIAGFYWGPGGNLYFEEGTFKFSQVEGPNGLSRLGEAGIWRYNPRTEEFNVHVSFTFSNPWGFIFDRWGQAFIGDASGGLSYWETPISGRIQYPMKHPGGSHDRRVQKEVGKEKGYRFKTLYKKRTRPLGGCEILSSRHFPEDVQGNWLVTNCIGDRSLLSHHIEEKESGFWGTEVPAIVSCEDGNFRPVNVEMAPDGSIYIVDWHNALIGHLQHNLRDPSRDHSHGRIWRITYKGRPLVDPPKIDGAPVEDLLNILHVHENRTRYRAKRELMSRPTDEVIAAVEKWMAGFDKNDEQYEHNLLEALWLYQTHNVVNEPLLNQLLNAKDARARAAAVRVLSYWLKRVPNALELLKKGVEDEHPRVRIEAVRAFSFMEGDDAIEAVLQVLEHEMDYYLEYTLDETMRSLEN